jgi:transposase, IS30 family
MELPGRCEIGISRTTANNWSPGYKVYRRGQLVGFVPRLERLAVRQIGPRSLSQDERMEIADHRQAGASIRQIARRLGRDPRRSSRELRRNATRGRGYRPFDAHRHATTRRARHHRRRLDPTAGLQHMLVEPLARRWSRQQASHLRRRFPEQPAMWLCHESIYQASISRDRRCCDHSGWRRIVDHRCAPSEEVRPPAA